MRASRGAGVLGLLEFHGAFIVRTYSDATGKMECWNNGLKSISPSLQNSKIPLFHFFLTFSLTTNRRSGYKGVLPQLESLLFELDNSANPYYKIKTVSVF